MNSGKHLRMRALALIACSAAIVAVAALMQPSIVFPTKVVELGQTDARRVDPYVGSLLERLIIPVGLHVHFSTSRSSCPRQCDDRFFEHEALSALPHTAPRHVAVFAGHVARQGAAKLDPPLPLPLPLPVASPRQRGMLEWDV